MAEQPGTATETGAGTRRGRTIQVQWASAVLGNIYECTSRDPGDLEVWCYTDRLSYAPGDTVQFHVKTTAPAFDLEIVRDGQPPETVHRADGPAGAMHETPVDCSVNGCGWPAAYSFTLPDDWRYGVYIVRSYARRSDEVFDHLHMFNLRPAKPGRDARMVLVCSTGTWMAYNEWGGSNHYEGIAGPNLDEFSTRLSIHRPWSRGFVWLPKGAPHIALAKPPGHNDAVRYPHMEWSYTNGYSKKYDSAGWASYERNFAVWAEEQGYTRDIIALYDLPDDPGILGAYDCAVFIGHDEYWSWENDPLRETDRSTTRLEAPEVGRPGALTFGLNASQGVYTRYGFHCPRAPGGFTVYRPEHWALEGRVLYYGDVFGSESTGDDGAPDGIEIIAMGLTTLVEDHHGHEGVVQYLEDLDPRFIAETMHGEATPETIDRVKRGSGMMVTMPKGQGEVFHAGTTNWVAGLIDHDPFVERITRNVLDRYLA